MGNKRKIWGYEMNFIFQALSLWNDVVRAHRCAAQSVLHSPSAGVACRHPTTKTTTMLDL